MRRKGEKRDGQQPTPFMVARWRDGEEKGAGGPGSAPRGGWERGRERGPRAWQGQLGQPTSAPGRRVAPLPRDRGGRRGARDAGASG
jgi:hypothetical protein